MGELCKEGHPAPKKPQHNCPIDNVVVIAPNRSSQKVLHLGLIKESGSVVGRFLGSWLVLVRRLLDP